jgi:hypothetical protein
MIVAIDEISDREVKVAIGECREIRNAPPVESANPFLIIKPLGYRSRDAIRVYLAEMGYPVLAEAELSFWPRLSLFLYMKDKTGLKAAFRIARNRAYEYFEPSSPALLLLLPATAAENELFRIKYELRGLYGEEYGAFRYQGETHLMKATCVHVPNFEDLPYEHRVVRHFLQRLADVNETTLPRDGQFPVAAPAGF